MLQLGLGLAFGAKQGGNLYLGDDSAECNTEMMRSVVNGGRMELGTRSCIYDSRTKSVKINFHVDFPMITN